MSLLFRIVYAAHANGTHHKLALDALRHMTNPDADAWQRAFLKHVALYLEGSKAPDKSFKDFKNHVLHVGEKYWGGAPEKVEAWYGHTVDALRAERWADAAYAAGVLSHYYTDPIHPFHTGQTEAENSIHRAVEWTINRSYNALRTLGEARHPDLDVRLPGGERWLREMVCDGAEYSHRYYEKLIVHYDFNTGVVRPEDGFDEIGRNCVAELLIYAADGFAHILDRAITEAGVAPPAVNLTVETVLATANIPRKWIEKKLANAEDRAIVQAMYDELKATGRVEQTLPEDDRTIRDLHAREVLMPALAAQAQQRAQRVPEGDPADAARAAKAAAAGGHAKAPAAPVGRDRPAAPGQRITATKVVAVVPPANEPGARRDPAPDASSSRREAEPSPRTGATEDAMPSKPAAGPAAASVPATASSVPSVPVRRTEQSRNEDRRRYLSTTDDLEAAPSIGPKMAARFAALGVRTVADFLGHDPFDLAELLDDKRFDGEVLTDWQDQAQLVIDVPGLRGTHAQLLVGAGYRTAAGVAEADPADLSADVLTFASSSSGQRVLRDGPPPDIEKIRSWASWAREALAA